MKSGLLVSVFCVSAIVGLVTELKKNSSPNVFLITIDTLHADCLATAMLSKAASIPMSTQTRGNRSGRSRSP